MKSGAIGIENRCLRSSVDAINGLFGSGGEVEKGGEGTHADNDLPAVRRPLGGEDQVVSLQNGARRLSVWQCLKNFFNPREKGSKRAAWVSAHSSQRSA